MELTTAYEVTKIYPAYLDANSYSCGIYFDLVSAEARAEFLREGNDEIQYVVSEVQIGPKEAAIVRRSMARDGYVGVGEAIDDFNEILEERIEMANGPSEGGSQDEVK